MELFHVETSEGDVVSSLDYGEMFLKPDLCVSKVLVLCNDSSDEILLNIKDGASDEYKISVKIFEMDDDEEVDKHFLQMISEMPQESIRLLPNTKLRALFLLTSSSLPHEATLQRKSRTSFFHVSPVMKFLLTVNDEAVAEALFPIYISLCLSLFSLDETDIVFDSCLVGNTYVRDVQVWNRSEGLLHYRVTPISTDRHLLKESPLLLSDFDTGNSIVCSKNNLIIPAFSSRRVRISFKATHVEDTVHRFRFENCNNSSNTIILSCRLTVFAEDDTDELVVENDSGVQIGVGGRYFDFGDCYNGVETVRKLWLRNKTNNTIEIRISTDCSNEIEVDTVSDQTSKKDRSTTSAVLQTPSSSGANSTPPTLTFGDTLAGQSARQLLEENESLNNINVKKSSLKEGNLVNSNVDTKDGSVYTRDRGDDITGPATYTTTPLIGKGKNNGSIQEKFQSNLFQNSSYYFDIDSFAGDFDSEDLCPGSQLRLQRFFIANSPAVIDKTLRSSHGTDCEYDGVNGYIRKQHRKEFSFNTKKNPAHDPKIGVRSRESDIVVLSPGSRKPFYLKFTPVKQRMESIADAMIMNDAATNVMRELSTTVSNREGKERASGNGRDRDSKKSLSQISINKAQSLSHSDRSDGVLERRTIKVTFMYKTATRYSKRDRNHDNVKQKVSTKHITCRAKTCTSVITCTPKVLDLGECNIGEFRNIAFTIKNESDLPALVLPYMESQSLGLVEKELHIPPRQSKQCKFEYVARNVESNYHKNILLINVFNSHCNLGVQVRAKISDEHQVLRHSLFYKIHTRSSKKQVQVYFSKCLYNMPNLKTFIFRNIYSKPLRVEMTVDDPAELAVYLHRPFDSFQDNQTSAYVGVVDKGVELQDCSKKSTTAHNQTMKIEELKWASSDIKPTRQKQTTGVGSQVDMGNSIAGDLAITRDADVPMANVLPLTSSNSISALDLPTSTFTTNVSDGGPLPPPAAEKKSFLNFMDSNDFPFSLLESKSGLVPSEIDAIHETNIGRDILDAEDIKESIGLVKKCYLDLKEDLVMSRLLLPLSTSTVRRSVVIPAGKSYEFVVIFAPKLNISDDGVEGDTTPQRIVRKINLQLLSTTPTDAEGNSVPNSATFSGLYDTLSPSLTSHQPLIHAGKPLKPRSLLVKAKLIRSQMKVVQRNINFGNTKVGELSRSSTTVANLSGVPLVYSISKSGSISSGFLSVSNGRKGIIEARSSKNIEFTFRPTLHGPFEETLTIENVLDNSNSQTVIIKAKVFKQELFTIQPLDGKEILQYALDEPMVQTVNNVYETEIMAEAEQKFAEMAKHTVEAPPPVYLGEIKSGVPSTVSIKFKICNVSSKNREFMLDCKDSVSLFHGNWKISDDFTVNILCRVVGREQLHLKSSAVNRNMSEEEKQQLRDKLEKFNQKLKIAIRKGKSDKIEKYSKKIKETEANLESGKFQVEEDYVHGENEGDVAAKLDNEEKMLSKTKSDHDVFNGTDEIGGANCFTFPLRSEECAVVIVNIVLLSAVRLELAESLESKPLPYTVGGSLRVFETKNEDDIRHILFGALLNTSEYENEYIVAVRDDENIFDVGENDGVIRKSQDVLDIRDRSTLSSNEFLSSSDQMIGSHQEALPSLTSIIQCKESVAFGEMVQGSTYVTSLQVHNTSCSNQLEFSITYANVCPTGRVVIPSENTAGMIEPLESKDLQIELQSLEVGRYDEEIVIKNLKNERDFVRVVLSGNVTLPQSRLVQFPDLEVDEMGKENKLDLGQIQVLQTNSGSMNEHQQEKSYKYPFRIMNLYSKLLYVSAVSNLKKQCLLYSDEECTQPVSNYPLSPEVMTTFFIVIRPSLTTSQQRSKSANNASDIFAPANTRISRDDKPSAFGRELLGGIRFVFLNEPEDMTDVKLSSLTRVGSGDDLPISKSASTPGLIDGSFANLDHLEKKFRNNKLFESSISFKVLVGTSLPHINMRSVRCRCVSFDHQESTAHSLSGALKGYFEIENKSKAFPYKYSIGNDNNTAPAECIDEHGVRSHLTSLSEQSISFCILNDCSVGEVFPSMKKRITFVVLFHQIFGMLTKMLEIKNDLTGKIEKVNINLFFDPCKLLVRIPRHIKDNSSACFLPSLRSQFVPGVLLAQNVFVTQINQIQSEVPIWVSIAPFAKSSMSRTSAEVYGNENHAIAGVKVTNATDISQINGNGQVGQNYLPEINPEGLTDENMIFVTGNCEDVICTWQLTNPHCNALRILPASDLPVIVQFQSLLSGSDEALDNDAPPQFQKTHASSLKALGNYLKGGNKKAKPSNTQKLRAFDNTERDGITGIFSNKRKEQRSMDSVSPELEKQGFSLCGEAVTVAPFATLQVIVKGNPGKKIAHHLRKYRKKWNSLLGGNALKVMGTIAFVSAEQTLKSFFDPMKKQSILSGDMFKPPSSNLITQNSGSSLNQKCADLYPTVGYTSVISSFFVPLINISRTKYHFGIIQSYKRHLFDIEIENICEREVSIRLENTHSWITTMETKIAADGCSCEEEKWSDTHRTHKQDNIIRVLPPRAVYSLRMCIVVPRRVTEKSFDHTMRLRNLSLSSTLSGRSIRTTLPIHVAFDINQNSGLSFQNETGTTLSFSNSLQSHIVKMENIVIPSCENSEKAKVNTKTIFVKNTTPDCFRVFYGTRESSFIKGLARMNVVKKVSGAIVNEDFGLSPLRMLRSPSGSGEWKSLDLPPPLFQNEECVSFFELMPGESAELELSIDQNNIGRITAEMTENFRKHDDYFEEDQEKYVDNESEDDQFSDHESVASVPEEHDDSKSPIVGPVILGKTFFKFCVISMTEAETEWSSSNIEDAAPHETVYEYLDVNVVGSLVPGPTLVLKEESGQFVNSFSFLATPAAESARDDGASGHALHTAITVRNKIIYFTVANESKEELKFRFMCSPEAKSDSYRLVSFGAKTKEQVANSNFEIGYQEQQRRGHDFNDIQDSRYDLLPLVHPTNGHLMPGESVKCSITFVADPLFLETEHNPSFGSEEYDSFFANLLAFDDLNPVHPPLELPIYMTVQENDKLPKGSFSPNCLKLNDDTNGLRDNSDAHITKLHVDANIPLNTSTHDVDKKKERKKRGSFSKQNETSSIPTLRLRGVTPCAHSTSQYEINLGQENQQPDKSKWVVSLINTSATSELRYVITTLSPEVDTEWISFSQENGTISPDGTSSLVLHFVRANVGIFLTYLIIENQSNPVDIVLVRMSMQVVQDWQLRPPVDIEYLQLFRIETPLGWHVMDAYLQQRLRQWNHRSKNTSYSVKQDPSKSKPYGAVEGRGAIDFGSVYIGRVYTRRYFILVNMSDTPLEFQLSSTFQLQELDFSLSPVLPSPLSVVTVPPRDRMCVYIVFRPQLHQLRSDTAKRPFQQRVTERQVEGSIFVSCRLVKNHHESINIRATTVLPTVGVFLKEHMLNLPTSHASSANHGIHELDTAIMQLGVPQYADVFADESNETIRINTDSSSSIVKDSRWTTASVISIRNISQNNENVSSAEGSTSPLPTEITIYTGMARNGFEIRLIQLNEEGNVDEELTATKNCQWYKGGGEGGGSTIDISLFPLAECFLHISYNQPPDFPDKRHGRSTSIDKLSVASESTFTIIAEDHFVIYRRHRISEKIRIPVRLLWPITKLPSQGEISTSPIHETKWEGGTELIDDQSLNLARDLDKQSSLAPAVMNVTPATEIPLSFAGLEGTISSFLKQYCAYWAKVTLRYVSLPNASLQPHQANTMGNMLTSSSTPEARHSQEHQGTLPSSLDTAVREPHDQNDLLLSQYDPQQSMEHFFADLSVFLTVTDNSIYVKKVNNESENNLTALRLLAHELAELHFHFVAITDMLVLHTMRQSYHGDEWMTSAHTAIPVEKLSLLLFSMVFKHPVFVYYFANDGENQRSEATLFPPPLIPFARVLLYYMGFFPEAPAEMESLSALCHTIRQCLQIKFE